MENASNVNYFPSEWEMYGPGFKNSRKARILAGRLWLFVSGTKVTKQKDGLYYVWIWTKDKVAA